MLGKIFKKKNCKEAEDISRYTEDLVLDLSTPDREEDGFLLVGESLYERNVIYARDFQQSQKCSVDRPPAYETLCQLTSSMGNTNQPAKQTTAPENGNGSTEEDCKLLDLCEEASQSDTSAHHSLAVVTAPMIGQNFVMAAESEVVKHAYEDIPFQLSPVLKGVLTVSRIQEDNGALLRSVTTDLKKYDYEFTLEKSVLQGFS